MMRYLAPLMIALVCSNVGWSQVFSRSPTASSGAIEEGTGQALYGGFGLDAGADPPATPAYNIYRKYGLRSDPDWPLQEANNDAGNPSSMTWTGMAHNGDRGIIDPGMFIGTASGTTDTGNSSPADQLLYFRPAIDEEGGGNDDNFRRDWDVRVGFLEDPQAFIDSRDPNSEAWDLWSGEWLTDGVSVQLNMGTNELAEETDWYTRSGNGFRLNAAESVFGDERGRDPNPMDRFLVGSGDEVELGPGENAFAGVGYNDAIEVSWNMELNDPDNANAARAREVLLTVKIGNIIQQGVFDPGAEGSPVEPNSGDGEEFSGGFFDWQSATPVFFVAPVGGGEASGTMGIFIPGDFNADGVVNDDDRAIITANLDQFDTTYSRGDLNQDGTTNQADLDAYDGLGGSIADQIDRITDLNERIAFVHDVAGTWMGDSNLDGEFNSSDFVFVFTKGEYEDGVDGNSTWVDGDWNGDSDFTSSDFVTAFTDGGFELGPRPATAAVPEPGSLGLWLIGLGVGAWAMRRQR